MKTWFTLSAIGPDRPGIVADLAEMIFELDGNLEDSSMTILGGEFAVLLLLSGSGPDFASRLSAACKRLEWEKRLTVFVRPLEAEPVPRTRGQQLETWELSVLGLDKAGIVAKVARCLADHGASITHMSSSSRPQTNTGVPEYQMEIRLDLPADADIEALRRDLDGVAASLHVDLTLGEPLP